MIEDRQAEIDEQRKLLRIHRETLTHYLAQQALIGEALIPPSVAHGIVETRENIMRVKRILHEWEIVVEDHPDDSPSSDTDKTSFDTIADIQSNVPQTSPKQPASVRLSIERWAYLVERTPKLADRLLHEQNFTEGDILFLSLDNFLRTSLESGLSIEIHDYRVPILEIIQGVSEFWLAVLTAVIVNTEGTGPAKWLVKETVKSLQESQIKPDSMLCNVWWNICQIYCNHLSRYHKSEILDVIVNSAIEISGGKNYEFMYRFFTFFYDQLDNDTLSIRKTADYLEKYDQELGNNASPAFLERLKRLVGVGIAFATHGIDDIPSFKTSLTKIPEGLLCNYSFDSMVYPLTIHEYSMIRGVPPKNLGENPKYPYGFKIVSENKSTLYNLLESEVSSIIKLLCERFEENSEYKWDIPTICEWLTLAGCESQPYPWGSETPTQLHASLHFDGSIVKLRPVGTHSLGVSRFGVYDCCGNVHEIVRVSECNHFPECFRLAGGCYQTSKNIASCQIIRRFKTKKEDNRRNVGIRLIRHNKHDYSKRFQALREFLESNHPSSILIRGRRAAEQGHAADGALRP
jgi:hypothetical protein